MADPEHDTRTWFFWLGRIETASFVLLLAIAMPLKYVAGQPAAVGWCGWLHGVLLIIYLNALLSVARVYVARAYAVDLAQVLLAAVLAVLPFGPLVLERRWRRRGVLDVLD
jgi:integral membrane protein